MKAAISGRSLAGLCCSLCVAIVCIALPFAAQADQEYRKIPLGDHGTSPAPAIVRLVANQASGLWGLEVQLPSTPQILIPLPIGSDYTVGEVRAASFITPGKNELFISFTHNENASVRCFVYAPEQEKFIFDSAWTASAFTPTGTFESWHTAQIEFPLIFDAYTVGIEDPERLQRYVAAGIYEADTAIAKGHTKIHGSHLVAARVTGSDTQGLSRLGLSYAVCGDSRADILGTYDSDIQYHEKNGRWRLQGDTQFTAKSGIRIHRSETPIPNEEIGVAWANGKLERKLPMPFASVQRIQSQAEFDALCNDYSNIAGNFDATAKDTWFFVPFVTPATFTVHAVRNNGGDMELTGIKAKYPLKTGQTFAYSGNWRQFTEETGGMEFQYVISFRQGEDGEEYFLWFLPDDTDVYLLRPGISKPHKE